MKNISLLVLLLAQLAARAQNKYTISGTITNKSNGETIIDVTIRSASTGTTTNAYGF